MHKIALSLFVAAAVAGCASAEADTPTVAIKTPAIKAPVSAQPPKSDPSAAICAWAKIAGIADLKVARFDSPETKRGVAALHGAWRVTCPADVAANTQAPTAK